MHKRHVILHAFLVAALALAWTGCKKDEKKDGKDGKDGGDGGTTYKSPKEVFEAFKESGEKEDYKQFVGCLTQDSKDVLAGTFAMGAVMQMSFAKIGGAEAKAKLKPIEEVLKKHGLTEEVIEKMGKEAQGGGFQKDPKAAVNAMKKFAEPIKDRGGFIVDYLGVMKKADEGKKDNPFKMGKAELKDLKEDGDTASGTVALEKGGEKDEIHLKFKKEGGGWKIELPMDEMMGKGKPSRRQPDDGFSPVPRPKDPKNGK